MSLIREVQAVLVKTAAVALFLAVWEALPRLGWVDRSFVPPFSEVAAYLWRSLIGGDLSRHLAVSLGRSGLGFGLALLVALPLGFVLGWFPAFERFVDPLLQVFRQTSAFALFPLFILFLGIGEKSKVAIIFYGAQWPLLLNTISGVKNVDPLLVKSARSMGLGRFALFRKVILPAALPQVFTGLRLAATLAILIIVAAESLGASSGLGYVLTNAQYNFDLPRMYAAIVLLALVGLATNFILVTLENRLTGWKPQAVRF
jgi:NitT/TauT family transport system permease protein